MYGRYHAPSLPSCQCKSSLPPSPVKALFTNNSDAETAPAQESQGERDRPTLFLRGVGLPTGSEMRASEPCADRASLGRTREGGRESSCDWSVDSTPRETDDATLKSEEERERGNRARAGILLVRRPHRTMRGGVPVGKEWPRNQMILVNEGVKNWRT